MFNNFLRTALVFLSVISLRAVAKIDVGLAKTPSGAFPSLRKNASPLPTQKLWPLINEKIRPTNARWPWRHINVSSRDRIVTVRGWVKGRVQANDLVKHARTTRCVRRVISKNLRTFRSTAGCLQGQKRCGDICIERNQECNLIQP